MSETVSRGYGALRPGLLVLVLLSVALLCWAPGARGASRSPSAAAQRLNPAKRVFVWATSGGGRRLGRPHDAVVRIRSHGKVIGRARTGVRGIAIVKLKRVPRQFSVQVSGGVFRGQRPKHVPGSLRVRVSGYRGGPVYVNPATTLLYYYAALHPRRSLRNDANHVAAFLRLPPGHDLEADMISSASFNGRDYLRRARRRGGIDAYSRALAHRVDVKRARASGIESSGTLGALASLSNSLNNYSGIFRSISGVSGALSIVNTAMTLAGVAPLNNELKELSEEMGQLLQEMQVVMNELGALRTQVEDLSGQDAGGTFTVLKGQHWTLMSEIKNAAGKWVAIANLGAQISCPNGTANCPEAKPVKQVCATSESTVIKADCAELEHLYTGSEEFLEYMKEHELTDFTEAESLAAAIGPEGLIKYGSLATAAGQRFYTSEQSAEAVSSADYYVAQLSLLISLVGAYKTAPTIEAPVGNWERELEAVTDRARVLPAQVPSVLPSANVIDTSTGVMWQAQLAANAVISSGEYGACPETGRVFCAKYEYPELTAASGGAIPSQMAGVGRWTYLPQEGINPDRWVSALGEEPLGVQATAGDDAPAKLGFEDWKPAPQTALEGLIAGTSYATMIAAGFSPKLFEVEEFAIREPGRIVAGGNTGVAVVLTLPGNGASSEFGFTNWAGFFNFENAGSGIGLFEAEGTLHEVRANYLMERTPAASECWYYASPEQHASC